MSYPKGLVRYTTENALENGVTNVIRPRVVIYAVFLLAISAALIFGLFTRNPVHLDVIRDRNVLYRVTDEGMVENIYTLKIVNKDHFDHQYQISVDGLEGLSIKGSSDVTVRAAHVEEAPIGVLLDSKNLNQPSADIRIRVTSIDNPNITAQSDARFLVPR